MMAIMDIDKELYLMKIKIATISPILWPTNNPQRSLSHPPPQVSIPHVNLRFCRWSNR